MKYELEISVYILVYIFFLDIVGFGGLFYMEIGVVCVWVID